MTAFTTGGGSTVPDDFPPVKTTQPNNDGGSSLGDMFTDELLNNWQWGVNPDIFNEPYSEERCDILRAMGRSESDKSLGATPEQIKKILITVLEHEGRQYNADTLSKYVDCMVEGQQSGQSSSGLWIGVGIAAVAVGIFALTLRKK